jgi:hypothetical protein
MKHAPSVSEATLGQEEESDDANDDADGTLTSDAIAEVESGAEDQSDEDADVVSLGQDKVIQYFRIGTHYCSSIHFLLNDFGV